MGNGRKKEMKKKQVVLVRRNADDDADRVELLAATRVGHSELQAR